MEKKKKKNLKSFYLSCKVCLIGDKIEDFLGNYYYILFVN